MNTKEPISDDLKTKKQGCTRVFFALFGLAFLGVGLGVFIFNGLMPYLQEQQSTDWPTAPCEITQASIAGWLKSCFRQSRRSQTNTTRRG